MPAVAIVIPAYNPGPLLERALESVRAQTFSDWECVVLDDGGAEALDWVDGFDPRVTRHRQENAGVSVARNVAAARTSAPLIAYLDQDDEWLPDKLAAQVPRLGDRDFSYTAFVHVGKDGAELIGDARRFDYASFLDDGHLCLSTLMVRRALLERSGGFSPLLRVQQDYELVLRFLTVGARAAPLDEVLARYHLHSDNVSDDYLTGYRERLAILSLHEADARRRGDAAVLAAIRSGRGRTRELYGSKAFDGFRATHAPIHMARAAAWNPRYSLPQLVRGLYGQARSAR